MKNNPQPIADFLSAAEKDIWAACENRTMRDRLAIVDFEDLRLSVGILVVAAATALVVGGSWRLLLGLPG